MRILHLVKSFNFGGAENHVRDLANVMDKMDNDLFIISKKGEQLKILNKEVKFIDLRMQDILLPLHIYFVVKVIRKYKIDVLHAHQRLSILIGCIAGKITGIPVFVTVHGQPQYDLRSRLSKTIPDKFVFVRQRSITDSLKYGIPKEKSVLIQNGVSILKSGKQRDHYSLCYISRIDKRHSSVILMIIRQVIPHLCEEYPDLTFSIVGDGYYLNSLKREADIINKKFNRQIILFHGYISDVRNIIEKSGLVMGVGRVAIETLACGVPLLSVNQKCLGGLVNRDNYPFYRINNFVAVESKPPASDKLLSIFKEYLNNINYWNLESSILQKNIDRDFNIDKITGEILQLYRETLQSKANNLSD